MDLHPSVADRLTRLAPDQRAAATAPPGPVLCVAPAGSGKTTTLVARIAWLVASGTARPGEIAAITFNTRAADEMRERLDPALEPLGVAAGAVRVRTFHALGLEVLRTTGDPLPALVDRESILRTVWPDATAAELGRLDTAFSRLKLELQVEAGAIAGDPDAGPLARAFVAYEAALAEAGAMDFDDLVRRSLRALRESPALLADWRARCRHLLVDEVQDVDRSQLDLALLLAAPDDSLFCVGDDDQSIYGWRLADVRRILDLGDRLPGLSRVDLEVNYRCPSPVVTRAVRLVEHNGERFAKRIRAGPAATGRLVLAPDAADETVRLRRAIGTWPDDGSTRAILARTNRELLPAVAVALELGLPFRAPRVELLLDSPLLDATLGRAEADARGRPGEPLLLTLGRLRATSVPGSAEEDLATALLGWAVGHDAYGAFVAAIRQARARLAELRRDDAALTLATAHATKGLEFDHVVVTGMEAGRFPSARTVAEADDPSRALEEERRLAYVAWTRARRSLTILYDPAIPSPFLLEAFTADELGLNSASGAPPG
ncbi:MAG TPA: ATP-dependent helicase [Candidatus Limnocylindrales bacterium]